MREARDWFDTPAFDNFFASHLLLLNLKLNINSKVFPPKKILKKIRCLAQFLNILNSNVSLNL